MTAKSYLFAAVTSGLLLFFVVPLLGNPTLNPAEITSVGVETVISVAIAGLVAETFAIMKYRETQVSLVKAKKFFTCFICSLLFLAIVGPSIKSAFASTGVLEVTTTVVLLALSIALGGLTAEGFFSLIATSRARRKVSSSKVLSTADATQKQEATTRSENQETNVHLDSGLCTLGAALETKMQKLNEDLVTAIHQAVSALPATNAITSNPGTERNSQLKQELPLDNQSGPRPKDQVVEVLLGKAKVGGK